MNTKNTSNKGTYVGLRVLKPSNFLLRDLCIQNGIPHKASMFENRLHTTVIYSRKHCPNIQVLPQKMYVAEFGGYDIFSGQQGENVLVLKLKCQELQDRHAFLMQAHDATYDFPTYQPHVTLSYNYSDKTAAGITPFAEKIYLGLEYTEDLDLKWGEQ